ncbi:hypothetical protein [Streptomyces litmocidini]|uniref:hypothetical protein n=1 Tax=Streptomyces litmocidini TaxID=67318 RepID=UPI0036FB7771
MSFSETQPVRLIATENEFDHKSHVRLPHKGRVFPLATLSSATRSIGEHNIADGGPAFLGSLALLIASG